LKFRLWNEHKLDPEWIEKIPYYEFQIWLDKINKSVEKQNKENMEDAGQSEVFNFSK
jgi:G:T-mismatch repair DNA endonuclease (very short patch repair protein)